jgi:hypothetical protein
MIVIFTIYIQQQKKNAQTTKDDWTATLPLTLIGG